jgi:hypothetical protein
MLCTNLHTAHSIDDRARIHAASGFLRQTPLRRIESVLFFSGFRVSANSVRGDVVRLIEDENENCHQTVSVIHQTEEFDRPAVIWTS